LIIGVAVKRKGISNEKKYYGFWTAYVLHSVLIIVLVVTGVIAEIYELDNEGDEREFKVPRYINAVSREVLLFEIYEMVSILHPTINARNAASGTGKWLRCQYQMCLLSSRE